MATLKASIKAAKESIASGTYKEALQHCKAALKTDKASYEAYLLLGKAAYLLEQHEQAGLAYSKAAEINHSLLPAWKGLAELRGATDDAEGLADALEHLLSLSEEAAEKLLEYRKRLAGAYIQLARPRQAADMIQIVLKEVTQDDMDTISLLCKLADLQEASGASVSDLEQYEDTLQAIVERTEPTSEWLQYHERWLKQRLAQLPPYTPRSTDWLQARIVLLDRCCKWAGVAFQGAEQRERRGSATCPSHVVLEAVLDLLDDLTATWPVSAPTGISREGASLVKQRAASALAHAFPWRRCGCVVVALELHKRLVEDPERPAKTSQLARIAQALMAAGIAASGYSSAWQVLAELQLQTGKAAAAATSCAKGLAFLVKREASGHPPCPEVALGLRLAAAHADVALGNLAQADIAFRGLAEESKSVADSSLAAQQRLRALLGLAASASARGETKAAQTLYKHVLGQPIDVRGLKGQLLSDYGWLLFQAGNYEDAKLQLDEAIKELTAAGGAVTDARLGEAHFRLGRICWELGGALKQDRNHAHRHWIAAAAHEGPSQAPALAWLGKYYEEVVADLARAQRCYQRALALDPLQASAGEALCRLLRRAGAADKALKLCQEIVARSPAALWAWRRCGRLQLESGHYQQAVVALQTVLRGDAGAADTWEALGAAYQALGRLTAAIKAYGQAVTLQPTRVYSHVQAGIIQLSLGALAEALPAFQAALALDDELTPAQLGAGEALLASAKHHMAMGALGTAAKELQCAERHALQAARHLGNIRAAWKLLGDVQLAHHGVTPLTSVTQNASEADEPWKAGQLDGWGLRITAVRASRRSYAKALHLAPWESARWGDLAAAVQQEAGLRRAHAALLPEQAPNLQAQAARLIRGGLRLDATSAALWAALGNTSGRPRIREFALGRALQLQPKLVSEWVALGRLYVDAGDTRLAGRCFATARSHEPTMAATWEGMGALAALSATGASERVGDYEHAVRLGAGKEALLGFVEGALKTGRGHDASVYAAVCRAAELAPLIPAAHNALGLVLEVRGAYNSAAEAFKHALAVIQAEQHCTGNNNTPGGNLTTVEVTGHNPPGILPAIQINLGRALALAGLFEDSAASFDDLQFMQQLEGRPLARAAFLHALCGKGSAAAAERGLQALLNSPLDAQVQAEFIQASCQQLIQRGNLPAAQDLLRSQLDVLIAAKAPNMAVEESLLTLLAGAAKLGSPHDTAAVREMCTRYAAAVDDAGGADFVARQIVVEVCAARIHGRVLHAARLAAQAAHLCPWQPQLWGRMGTAALQASAAAAGAASRACRHPGLARLDEQSQAGSPAAIYLKLAKATRAVASLARPTGLACNIAAAELKECKRWLHLDPHEPIAWLLAALLCLRYAQNAPSVPGFRRTQVLAATALSGLKEGHSGCEGVLAACALSEAYLQLATFDSHSGYGSREHALTHSGRAADEAISVASHTGSSKALALSQVARYQASLGDWTSAKGSYREAIASASSLPETATVAASFAAAARKHVSLQQSMDASAAAMVLVSSAEAQLQGPGEKGVLAYLMLQRSLLVAAGGDVVTALHIADSAAEQSVRPGQPTHQISAGVQSAIQVVLGALHLKDARASGSMAAVSEARRALAPVADASSTGASLAHLMLAEAEMLGSARKKDERVHGHVQQALRLAERPLSPRVIYQCAQLSGSLPLACAAVHLQPWEPTVWARLVK